MSNAGERKLRLGVAGLGRAFTLMLPTFAGDPRVTLVAAADTRGSLAKVGSIRVKARPRPATPRRSLRSPALFKWHPASTTALICHILT